MVINYIILILLYNLLQTTSCNPATRKGLKVNYRITGFNNCLQSEHVLTMIRQVLLSQCVDECAFRANCRAINYFNRYHLCHLLPNDDGSNFESAAKSRACVFVKKAEMNIMKISEKCTCGAREACDLETGASCAIKECESFTILNGTVVGNVRLIGASIKYECNPMFFATFQEPGATCLTNGTWSYTLDGLKDMDGNHICTGCIPVPKDCQDIQFINETAETGVYEIYPTENDVFKVRCDMDTSPGGWTVFQHRESNSDFLKNWQDYKEGFGDLHGNFWLGNDKIWKLTNSNKHKLRVDLRDQNGAVGYAEYSSFSIGDESTKYILNIAGHSGTATDSLVGRHNGMRFSTFDQDHDTHYTNCASYYKGGWWYSSCQSSNLNGPYGNVRCNDGMTWKDWRYRCVFMRFTEMKIRRT